VVESQLLLGGKSMKNFREFCTKTRVIAAEIVSTVVFLVFLYVAARYEITHLLGR
jgi:hypothetical protein